MLTIQDTLEKLQGDYGVDHYEVPLEEIHINSPDSVTFSGEDMALSKNGKRSLCRLLEIPNTFNTRLHADDTALWKDVVKRLEALRSQEVRVSIAKSSHSTHIVDAFNKTTTGWIANEEFLKMVQFWLEFKPVKFELSGIGLDTTGMCVAHFNLPELEGKILSNPTDVFKMGLTLVNSETVRVRSRISLALHRMICTNRAMAPDKEYSIVCRHTKGSQRLIEDLWSDIQQLVTSNISVQSFIDARIGRLTSVNASLRELEQAHKLIHSGVSNVEVTVPSLDTRIPLQKIASNYGGDWSEKSEHWKSTASTPINLYDLYNEVTWIGSHSEISPEERDALEVKIGSLFLSSKEPDMRDIAPARSWN